MSTVIVDTGPIVAYLLAGEEHHSWVTLTANHLPGPFLTTEPVIGEACFLLQTRGHPVRPLAEMLAQSTLLIALDLKLEQKPVFSLMQKYASVPMSLADATLVRLAEMYDRAAIFTLDSDFRIYRKHGRRQIPLIFPDHHR